MTNVYIVSERSLELGGSGESRQKKPATVAILGSKTQSFPQPRFSVIKGFFGPDGVWLKELEGTVVYQW